MGHNTSNIEYMKWHVYLDFYSILIKCSGAFPGFILFLCLNNRDGMDSGKS